MVSQSFCLSVCLSHCWSNALSVGRSDSWSFGRSVGRSDSRLVSGLARQQFWSWSCLLDNRPDSRSDRRFLGGLVCQQFDLAVVLLDDRSHGRWVGRSVDRSVDRSVGLGTFWMAWGERLIDREQHLTFPARFDRHLLLIAYRKYTCSVV